MSRHLDHCHHHPSVRRTAPKRGPWRVTCSCGSWPPLATWRAALVAALTHAEVPR